VLKIISLTALALCFVAQAHATSLIRYPSTSKTEIAFVAHDQLWIAPIAGGTARRLTHDPGAVTTPRFSPDGRWIAYTARHGGLRDVFVLAAKGGEPRRLTFEASSTADGALVVGWTPDSKHVVFLSHRTSPFDELVQAFTVPVTGGFVEPLPLDRAGMMSFASDGKAIAYNRIFRNLDLRKRYLGGQQQDIYTYNFDTRTLTQITDWKGTDTAPMWFGRKIYFLSDRGAGFRDNIWSYDLDSKTYRQITNFANYDVDWPSLGGFTITFQQGGRLFAIDLPSERLHQIKVDVPDDGERTATHNVLVGGSVRVTDAMHKVDYALSPSGEGLLLSARGDLFLVGLHTAGKNLTRTPAVDEDHPAWSPDGRTIAYETDVSGEQQIAVRPTAGGAERLLTRFTTGYFYTPVWSPLGDSVAVADVHHSLWWIHLDGRTPKLIASDPYAEIRDAAFSPDGKWLAYSTQRASQVRAIHMYELASGKDTIVSSPMESDRSPVFTPDGRLLIFVSQRNEQPFVSDRDDESLIATLNSDGLYAATLNRHTPSPLVSPTPRGAPDKKETMHIDVDGLMSRAVALPVTPAVISTLDARGSQLFYQTEPPQLIDGDLAGGKSALHAFDLATLQDRVVVDGLDNASLSADGAKVAFRCDGAWQIAPTQSTGPNDGEALDLTDLSTTVDPRREWAEMFENAWRLDRDAFFNEKMNGSPWQAVHDAYAKLLPQLGSQDDFLYVLGQMQGEIASSHTFMRQGVDSDPRKPVHTALLGADYVLEPKSGRYRFAHIYPGDQTRSDLRGPLGQPGLNVKTGDYLLSINGHDLQAPADPNSLLNGVTGQVSLTIAPSLSAPRREVNVASVASETKLRRLAWIEKNRLEVDQQSAGRLGYVFMYDFSDEGSKEFVRQFYPQRNKAGLVIDVRWNYGGFTSQAVLDVLRRELAGVFINRERAMTPLPAATAPRVMVTLINDGSSSDGDQFPYFFRKFGLGKLIGERSWGGVQGINGPWGLMDGSSIRIPKDALASLDGHWVIENEGVTPDIAVAAPPEEALTGKDAQLMAAITTALEQLDRSPTKAIQAPNLLPAYPPAGNVPGASFKPGN
jgi:tricorn protease